MSVSPEEVLSSFSLLWQAGVPLKDLCHWRIGGPADYVVTPRNPGEVLAARDAARTCGLPFIVIGHGSNMLFDDAGYRGIVIKIGSKFSGVSFEGTRVTADAGVWVPSLARLCASRGLAGLEHTVGIPGNLGGLVFMNGGSMRKNIGDVIKSVKILDREGCFRDLQTAECGFSYRHSVFQGSDYIILAAVLELTQSTSEVVRRELLGVLKERKGKFPLSLPNCGSVFSNSPDLYASYGPPGMVIDKAGLKGTRVGDAQVSPVHANFIVNLGNATSRDVFELIGQVREHILKLTGFTLKCEVRYVSPDGRCDRLDLFL